MKKKLELEELLENCPVQHALRFIGGKWRMGILWSLRNDYRRFGELKRDALGISEKMLIQELRHLEELGVISRQVYYVIPPKVEYRLTDRGKSIIPVIETVVSWGYADMEIEALGK